MSVEETAEAQRARILAAGDVSATDYDLAHDLGYQPESWDGMWKLTARDTFSYRHGCVIARELVLRRWGKRTKPGDEFATRLVAHRLPNGWSMIDDRRLLDVEPRIIFISPRDRARAEAITQH